MKKEKILDLDIDLKLLDPNKEGRQSNYPPEFFDFKDLTLNEVATKVNQGKHLILKGQRSSLQG